MPEPQDIAALREVAETAVVVTSLASAIGGERWRLDNWPDEVAAFINEFDPPTVLALLSEVERGRALRAAVEVLAEEFDSNVDWSAGRNNYGDNEAWESAARQARALLATHVPSPLPVGGAGEVSA